MTAVDLVLKEAELQQSVTSLTSVLPAEIVSDEQRVAAIEVCRKIKGKIEEVNLAYGDLITEAHKHHKNLIAKRDHYRDPLVRAYDKIEGAITVFQRKEEEKRLELERQLAEEAHKKQQESLFAEAASLERQGDTVAAEEVLQEAISAPAPMVSVQSQLTKVTGSYSRQLPWQFEIVDSAKVADHFWTPDLDAIGALVKSKGPMAENIIGKGSVRIWRDSKTVIRK
jgi:hypothetical protein